MRAGRLLNMVLLLQTGRRWTAAALADRLEVSTRTVLRDLEALSGAGVPVYSVRGPQGGFQMLDTFEQHVAAAAAGPAARRGHIQRVRVRIAPAALQMALITGTPQGWRPRPNAVAHPQRTDWLEGSFRFESHAQAERELLALGPHVEVLLPESLRRDMAALGEQISALHRP